MFGLTMPMLRKKETLIEAFDPFAEDTPTQQVLQHDTQADASPPLDDESCSATDPDSDCSPSKRKAPSAGPPAKKAKK